MRVTHESDATAASRSRNTVGLDRMASAIEWPRSPRLMRGRFKFGIKLRHGEGIIEMYTSSDHDCILTERLCVRARVCVCVCVCDDDGWSDTVAGVSSYLYEQLMQNCRRINGKLREIRTPVIIRHTSRLTEFTLHNMIRVI
jgi:hypothetical protein